MSNEINTSKIRSSLAELEASSNKILKKFEENDINKTHQSNIKPAGLTTLNVEKLNSSNVFENLENIICSAQSENGDVVELPALNEESRISILSQGIIKYLCLMDTSQLERVSQKINTETKRWIASDLFKLSNSAICYHKNSTDSMIRVIQLALFQKFSDHSINGLASLPSVSIYVSESPNIVVAQLQHSCKIVGLPQNSIKIVKNQSSPNSECFDVSGLKELLEKDIEDKVQPLLMLSSMNSFSGESDNLPLLKDLADKYNFWLHLMNPFLVTSVLPENYPNRINLEKTSCDSCDFNLGNWLGIAGTPNILIHKHCPNISNEHFESDPLEYNLQSLPLWTTLQNLGLHEISERLLKKLDASRIFFDICSRIQGIRMLSKKTTDISSNMTSKDIAIPVPAVVFQFGGSLNEPGSPEDKVDPSIQRTIEKIRNATYYDKLNNWLGQTLSRDFPHISLEIVEHEIYGVCLRYLPFEVSLEETYPAAEVLDQFAEFFENQVDILRATLKLKSKFIELVEKNSELKMVSLSDWAGLGGVMYVPEGWENLMTDQAKFEVNKLNSEIVETLRSADNAFSLGEGDDGLICVRFGMVTFETEISELLDLLIETGRSLQENSKLLDTFTDLVKKGIQQAESDLQKETEEKLWQEGILRHVPVLGPFVNWLSPNVANEAGIKGRSLNLLNSAEGIKGVVESTETIYKYHYMQKPDAGHSRNASESSNVSNK